MGCAQVYVHRVGRTGRAGQAGTAVTLFTPQDAELEAELTQQLGGAPQPSAPAAGAEEGEGFFYAGNSNFSGLCGPYHGRHR